MELQKRMPCAVRGWSFPCLPEPIRDEDHDDHGQAYPPDIGLDPYELPQQVAEEESRDHAGRQNRNAVDDQGCSGSRVR